MLPWIQRQLESSRRWRQKKTAHILAGCLLAVFFVGFFSAPDSLAQGTPSPRGVSFGLQPIAQSTVLSTQDIRLTIARIIRAALGLLGIVALVIILYAGYVIMTSGGNEDKVADGKKILVNAVIGIAIILSALAITQFIITRLAGATGAVGPEIGGGEAPGGQSFAGSGALGRIIADHFPFRDQREVHRNTRITITFREPIDPSSIFDTTNQNSASFGSCGQPFNWNNCPRVRANAVHLAAAGAPTSYLPLHGLASLEGVNHQVFTVIFQPDVPLGSDTQPVPYTVDLTSAIRKADGRTSAFVADRDGHYTWNFETDTLFDFTPPTIVSTYPAKSPPLTSVPRNTIVQIQFSKPIDPSSVQGLVASNSDFTNVLFGDRAVQGNWHITNGYTTLEFVSSLPCGVQNSCGDEIYCLPPSPGTCPADNPDCNLVLVRTAALIGSSGASGNAAFQSIPLTGVADMSGNALDGDGNLPARAEGKPNTPSDLHTIGSREKSPDNFYWSFRVTNEIDTRAPYIRQVTPGLDQESVDKSSEVTIRFNTLMWGNTLNDIDLEEHGNNTPPQFWRRLRAGIASADQPNQTVAHIDHRNFSSNAYYFPIIPSTVKSVTQNCLYPGRGPVSRDTECQYEENPDGTPVAGTGSNCVGVSPSRNQNTGCVQTTNQGQWLQPDINNCLSIMRGTISPL